MSERKIIVVPIKSLGECSCISILKKEGFLYCPHHERYEADLSLVPRAADLVKMLWYRKHDSDIIEGEVCADASVRLSL